MILKSKFLHVIHVVQWKIDLCCLNVHLPGSVRIGDIDGEFVVNPSRQQLDKSILDLIVTSTDKKVGKFVMACC